MGEVFLARDHRLDRLVAIKALPAHLASDADRLARFQREAKVLASLSHAGIGTIYGLEEDAGQQYLILEYVEGETLADRLGRGAIPVEEALTIARQVAEALEAAHEKGVVHRDVKPGNVMMTPEGAVKVLDFGIARAGDSAPIPISPVPATPDAATVKSPAKVQSPTIPGAIMGSPGYMSPEQALGRAVDKRSDVFAFGCVLYEMLAGAQAFPGENVTDALGAILHREPDWSRLSANTPARVRELLATLLHKDRKQRMHDIGDARLALERAIEGREWASVVPVVTRRHTVARAGPWMIVVASIAAAGAALWRAPGAPRDISSASPRASFRLRIDPPASPVFSQPDTGGLAVSPDGKQIAYRVATAEGWECAIHHTDEFTVQRLGVDLYEMFFSPDGRLLGGQGYGAMMVCPVGGGTPARLFEGPRYTSHKGGAWSAQGIVFSPTPSSGLLRISERGGEPETLTVPDASRDEIAHRWPDVLPDGKILFTIKKAGIRTFDDAEIALLDPDKKAWKTIIRGGSYARFVPTGHIVFARNGSIIAVPFDAARGEVTGTPVAVVNGVMMSPGSGAAKFAIARDAGSLVYIPGGNDESAFELVWVDLKGAIEPLGAPIMTYTQVVPSPDGGRIATGVFGASDAIFVYDLARHTNTRLTFRGNCSDPIWTRDGTKIAYISDADGKTAMYQINADGSGSPEKIMDRAATSYRFHATVDGKPVVVFEENGDIWLQPFNSESRQKLVGTQFNESSPHLSPDGRWLSYSSNETGQEAIYVRPFPSGDGRWQVMSTGISRQHCWAPDGSAIFCVGLSESRGAVFRVPFETSPTVAIGTPELMFTLPQEIALGLELVPGTGRFVSCRLLPAKFKAEQVCVVLNWFEELKAKVPAGSR
jgi:serine/threonine-protein kinase